VISTINGKSRILGLKPRTLGIGDEFKVFGEVPECPLVPPSQWVPVSNRHRNVPILDQDGIGKCASSATVGAMRSARVRAGMVDVELADDNLYARVNGGSDSGSTLSDNLLEAMKYGVCQRSLVPQDDWRHGLPDGWEDNAGDFLIVQAYDCPSFEAIASAIQLDYDVVFGVLVGTSFDPDAEGFVPYGRGNGGHAMRADGMIQHPKTGEWCLDVANSWGDAWGDNGRCYLPRRYIDRAPFKDAWAVRVMRRPAA
jgi:hypothetical protein